MADTVNTREKLEREVKLFLGVLAGLAQGDCQDEWLRALLAEQLKLGEDELRRTRP